MRELTKKEKKAIADLRKIAEKWPQSLWLFSANGDLCIMRYKNKKKERGVLPHGGMDTNYCVDTIYGIDNDGGDW